MTGRLKEFFSGFRKSDSYRNFCLALSSRKGMYDGNYLDSLSEVNAEVGAAVAEIMYTNWENCTPAEHKVIESEFIHDQIAIAVESARRQAYNILPEWYGEMRNNALRLNEELSVPFPI